MKRSIKDQQDRNLSITETAIFDGLQRRYGSGWKTREIAALMMYTAKEDGLFNILLGKFLQIYALIANNPKDPADENEDFPASVHCRRSLLGMKKDLRRSFTFAHLPLLFEGKGKTILKAISDTA